MSTASSEPTAADKVAKDAAETGGPTRELFELGKTVFYALMIALALRIVLFQPFTIPSASMVPTLLEGDYIVVSKFSYGWSHHSIPFSPPIFHGRIAQHGPNRGDVIVFKLPRDGHTDYIKRLVGLPGDTIQVKHGQVFINGKAVADQALPSATVDSAFGEPREVQRFTETLGKHQFVTYSIGADGPADNTGVYTVPKGCYFMMGDNRDNSVDSRFPPYADPTGYAAKACPWNSELDHYLGQADPGVGFVPAENIVGKAEFILLSWRQGASLFKPWTWFSDARFDRFFHKI